MHQLSVTYETIERYMWRDAARYFWACVSARATPRATARVVAPLTPRSFILLFSHRHLTARALDYLGRLKWCALYASPVLTSTTQQLSETYEMMERVSRLPARYDLLRCNVPAG